jgi:S-adenosyl methyltransferase
MNPSEIAQHAVSGPRIVYVDNDPLVLAHARAPLAGSGHNAALVRSGSEA